MWDGLDPQATDRALADRAKQPGPSRPAPVSAWAQVAEFAQAPFQGMAQGVNQTLRAGAALVSALPGGAPSVQAKNREFLDAADEQLRSNVDYWKPDPVASTLASQVLQDVSRVVTKAAGYALAAGPVGAAVGTGADEGVTGYLELRDQGVDPATAAKVGATRAVATGVGLALPLVGSTVARSAGLVAVGGPGVFMAEQSAARAILERARYPDLAAQHDPFDPVGLGVATLLPAVFGAGVHVARARAAARARDGQQATPAAPVPPEDAALAALADDPDVVSAAHVAYRAQTVDAALLGDGADLQARTSHAQALEQAAQALEAGEPVQIAAIRVDPARAERAAAAMAERVGSVADESIAARAAEPEAVMAQLSDQPPASAPDVDLDGAQAALQTVAERAREFLGLPPLAAAAEPPGAPALRRATEIVLERPELPVRLDDDGSPARPAAELLNVERQRIKTESREAVDAFEAAIECFLRTGAE